ncbi:MAG: NBR1-Ig-like domain-containing protein [Anaerolineales bacterium]
MKKNLIVVLILAILILSGCGNASEDNPSLTQTFEAALKTAVAETLQAELVAAETDAVPQNTEPPAEPEPSLEPTPTFTQQAPTSVPTLQPAQPTTGSEPTNTPQTPCYRAELISETIPDGTIFPPGQMFTKIWVIRNTGVCEWTEKFSWRLVEGEDFGIKHDLKLQRVIGPGDDLEVKLEMKTPLLEGNYKGTWQILTEEGGSVTPLGFWVYIISQK